MPLEEKKKKGSVLLQKCRIPVCSRLTMKPIFLIVGTDEVNSFMIVLFVSPVCFNAA